MSHLPERRIMVLEDSYYLAKEVRTILQGAGYAVVGPFATVRGALQCLFQEAPDCAVLDVNLGDGPSYDVGRELRRRKIPFLFFTGYDATALPPEFAGVRRLEKPVAAAHLLSMVDRCCQESLSRS